MTETAETKRPHECERGTQGVRAPKCALKPYGRITDRGLSENRRELAFSCCQLYLRAPRHAFERWLKRFRVEDFGQDLKRIH